MTRNSEKQLLTKLLTAWCNNKRQVGSLLWSNKKNLVQNIVIIVPTVYQYGSLGLWAHLALDNKYWKYLINGIVNAPTPTPGPPPFSDTEREQPPSPHSPLFPSQYPLTLYPPSQSTRPSPIPSTWEAPTTPKIPNTEIWYIRCKKKKKIFSGYNPTYRETYWMINKTQYRRLARIYHPDKHESESTGMTSYQTEEKFKNINNAYKYLRC